MSSMKALHRLKWPLILLLAGVVVFRLGAFLRMRQQGFSVLFVIAGYAMILAAIIWIILKIAFLKNPEDGGD